MSGERKSAIAMRKEPMTAGHDDRLPHVSSRGKALKNRPRGI
ncbi:hypothetical protein EKH55_2470 [Sinorhizobium alkalisoli]|nr:hypothetical protein EKH55_2470 [Sinorhizobium alkalisoli]